MRVALKPIATLPRSLPSADLRTGEEIAAHYERSDVCVVPAAGVIVEAMCAIVLAGALLEKFGGDNMRETLRNFASYQSTTGPRALCGSKGASRGSRARCRHHEHPLEGEWTAKQSTPRAATFTSPTASSATARRYRPDPGHHVARGALLGVPAERVHAEAALVVRAGHRLRQARAGALRSRRRADARGADRRRARRHGCGRLRARDDLRLVGGRRDVADVRRHLSRAHIVARARLAPIASMREEPWAVTRETFEQLLDATGEGLGSGHPRPLQRAEPRERRSLRPLVGAQLERAAASPGAIVALFRAPTTRSTSATSCRRSRRRR